MLWPVLYTTDSGDSMLVVEGDTREEALENSQKQVEEFDPELDGLTVAEMPADFEIAPAGTIELLTSAYDYVPHAMDCPQRIVSSAECLCIRADIAAIIERDKPKPLEPDAPAELLTLRCIVAGTTSDGTPGFYTCIIRCTQAQYENGEHYDEARYAADGAGYEPPYVVFDQNDGQRELFALHDWENETDISTVGETEIHDEPDDEEEEAPGTE